MKNLLSIIEFIGAVISFILLAPVMLLLNIVTPIFRKINLIKYYIRFLLQLYYYITTLFYIFAYQIDIFGNVISGEVFEWLSTSEKNTWFGDHKHTFSQAFGKLLHENKLNKTGLNFVYIIDSIFGENHCINAFLEWEYKNIN